MKAVAISRVKFFTVVAVLAAASLGLGCAGGGGGGESAADLIAQGWNRFGSGDFSGAVSEFNKAIALGATEKEQATAYDGLGWSYARLGQFDAARDSFVEVLTRLVLASQDTYAGISMVYLATKDYENASTMSNIALELYGDKYSFRYDPNVTEVTLRLVRAMSRFHLSLYELSYADVKLLGGPQDLSADDPDFVAELLEAIQDLREEYGQGLLNP